MSQILANIQPDDRVAHRNTDAAVFAGLSRNASQLAVRYEPIVALRLDLQNPRLHSRKQVRQTDLRPCGRDARLHSRKRVRQIANRAELAAIPETYAIAWTCLFRNLEITRGQTLVIRGAASAFGQAALKMAVDASVRVIATTRGRERVALLEQLGAERVETEGPELSQRIAEAKQLDAVLDLVGNSTILDSLAMLRRGGRACLAGWLGGLAPIKDFNPLLQMASGVYLTFFGSFVFGEPGFPLSDVPLQEIAQQVASGRLKAKPSRVFRFEEIHEAHRVMEANEAGGKMVVVIG